MARILVTGGAGFIGSHIVNAYLEQGHQVCVVDNLSTGSKANLNPKVKFYKVDIKDAMKLQKVFNLERPQIINHQAAQKDVRKSVEDPIFDARVNILGSLNLMQLAIKFKVKKFIFASSGGAIYGEAKTIPTPEDYPPAPVSPYGVAKLTVEKYLDYYQHEFKLPYISLRYANVYGPRQDPKGEAGVVAIFVGKLSRNEACTIHGDGKNTRDYIYVGDVVEANIISTEKEIVGAYNIGTGLETDVNELSKKIIEATGSKTKPTHGPAKPGEQRRSCLEINLAKKELGWEPKVELGEGIEKTVEWFKNK